MTNKQNSFKLDRDTQPQMGSRQLLPRDLEAALADARPRLLRFARTQGVAVDAADDVVQETLLEAWCHLDRLHTPQGIDAWLTSICQYVCLRWLRAQGTMNSHQISLSSVHQTANTPLDLLEMDIADPLALDLTEALSREDLSRLLDRSLGFLPRSTRQAIELCYLADLPHHEAALRLSVTINALEVRLHRAHQQLRQVLNGPLRAEAETLGLVFEQDEAVGWHETRMWCNLCGRFHLHGLFESCSDDRVHLRLRCPGCSPRYGDMFNSGLVSLDTFRTFRPAFKHAWKAAAAYWTQALSEGRQSCLNCKTQLVPLQIVRPSELTTPMDFPDVYRMILDCPRCGITGTCSVVSILDHPHISHFMDEHPRWIIGPESATEYAGHPALRTCLLDQSGNARLTVVVNRQNLRTLATFHN